MRDRPSVIDERGRLTADPVTQYLAEVGAHPLLTAAQEVELAQAIEAGEESRERLARREYNGKAEQVRLERAVAAGRKARSTFVSANLRLVVANARRYAGGSVDLLDLIQEGNLGLMRAVDKFDWRRGFKFSTYATWWIRQAMQRAVAQQSGAIRIPSGIFDVLPAVRTAREELQGRLGRLPTAAEISEATGVDLQQVERALAVSATVSLQSPVGEDGAEVGDFVAAEGPELDASVEERILSEALRWALSKLPEDQATIISLRFGLVDGRPRPVSEIAAEMSLSEEGVREEVGVAIAELAALLARFEDLWAA